MKLHLTDTAIERVERPEKGTVWLIDDELKGFHLALGKGTARFYVFLVKHGQNKRIPVGYWPATKVKAARAEAMKIIGDVKSGTYSSVSKETTLRDAFDTATAERVASGHLRETTATQYRAMFALHCKHLEKKPALLVSQDDIRDLKPRMADKPYAFNQVVRILSATYATKGWDSPTAKVKVNKDTKRQSKITDNRRWYEQVLAIENNVRRNYLLIAAATGIRRENLASLKWSQVDLNKKTIHLPTAKHNVNVTLPVSDLVLGYLKELHRPNGKHVFPAPKSKSGHIEDPRGPQDGTIHDLRRMFSSACYKARLFGPAVKKLRGDVLSEENEAYFTEAAPHEWANDVAAVLKKEWGINS